MPTARLILNKAALTGQKVSVWSEADQQYHDGTIEDYDSEDDCYDVVFEKSTEEERSSVQFHQFMVEEEGRQLVLKVTKCSTLPDHVPKTERKRLQEAHRGVLSAPVTPTGTNRTVPSVPLSELKRCNSSDDLQCAAPAAVATVSSATGLGLLSKASSMAPSELLPTFLPEPASPAGPEPEGIEAGAISEGIQVTSCDQGAMRFASGYDHQEGDLSFYPYNHQAIAGEGETWEGPGVHGAESTSCNISGGSALGCHPDMTSSLLMGVVDNMMGGDVNVGCLPITDMPLESPSPPLSLAADDIMTPQLVQEKLWEIPQGGQEPTIEWIPYSHEVHDGEPIAKVNHSVPGCNESRLVDEAGKPDGGIIDEIQEEGRPRSLATEGSPKDYEVMSGTALIGDSSDVQEESQESGGIPEGGDQVVSVQNMPESVVEVTRSGGSMDWADFPSASSGSGPGVPGQENECSTHAEYDLEKEGTCGQQVDRYATNVSREHQQAADINPSSLGTNAMSSSGSLLESDKEDLFEPSSLAGERGANHNQNDFPVEFPAVEIQGAQEPLTREDQPDGTDSGGAVEGLSMEDFTFGNHLPPSDDNLTRDSADETTSTVLPLSSSVDMAPENVDQDEQGEHTEVCAASFLADCGAGQEPQSNPLVGMEYGQGIAKDGTQLPLGSPCTPMELRPTYSCPFTPPASPNPPPTPSMVLPLEAGMASILDIQAALQLAVAPAPPGTPNCSSGGAAIGKAHMSDMTGRHVPHRLSNLTATYSPSEVQGRGNLGIAIQEVEEGAETLHEGSLVEEEEVQPNFLLSPPNFLYTVSQPQSDIPGGDLQAIPLARTHDVLGVQQALQSDIAPAPPSSPFTPMPAHNQRAFDPLQPDSALDSQELWVVQQVLQSDLAPAPPSSPFTPLYSQDQAEACFASGNPLLGTEGILGVQRALQSELAPAPPSTPYSPSQGGHGGDSPVTEQSPCPQGVPKVDSFMARAILASVGDLSEEDHCNRPLDDFKFPGTKHLPASPNTGSHGDDPVPNLGHGWQPLTSSPMKAAVSSGGTARCNLLSEPSLGREMEPEPWREEEPSTPSSLTIGHRPAASVVQGRGSQEIIPNILLTKNIGQQGVESHAPVSDPLAALTRKGSKQDQLNIFEELVGSQVDTIPVASYAMPVLVPPPAPGAHVHTGPGLSNHRLSGRDTRTAGWEGQGRPLPTASPIAPARLPTHDDAHDDDDEEPLIPAVRPRGLAPLACGPLTSSGHHDDNGTGVTSGEAYTNPSGYEDDDGAPLMRTGNVRSQQIVQLGVKATMKLRQVPQNPQEEESQLRRVALGAIIGNTKEWHDMTIFALLGSYISAAFFPPTSAAGRLLAVYALFLAGYLTRPGGALLFNKVAESKGRKTALLWSIMLLSVPTALLGAMPTWKQARAGAPILLLLLRLGQGLCCAGEFSGNLTYVLEHCPTRRKSVYASVIWLSPMLGILSASASSLFFFWIMKDHSLLSFGWRLPLLASIVWSLIGSVARLLVSDAEDYMSAQEENERMHRTSIRGLLKSQLVPLLLILGILSLNAVGIALLAIYMPVHYRDFTELSSPIAMTINITNLVLWVAMLPLGGWLADKYGRHTIVYCTSVMLAALAYPMWLLIALEIAGASWFAQMVMVVLMAFYQGGVGSFMLDAFPAGLRVTCLSIAHGTSLIFFFATAPLLATEIVRKTGDTAAPACLIVLSSVLSALSTWLLSRRTTK